MAMWRRCCASPARRKRWKFAPVGRCRPSSSAAIPALPPARGCFPSLDRASPVQRLLPDPDGRRAAGTCQPAARAAVRRGLSGPGPQLSPHTHPCSRRDSCGGCRPSHRSRGASFPEHFQCNASRQSKPCRARSRPPCSSRVQALICIGTVYWAIAETLGMSGMAALVLGAHLCRAVGLRADHRHPHGL